MNTATRFSGTSTTALSIPRSPLWVWLACSSWHISAGTESRRVCMSAERLWVHKNKGVLYTFKWFLSSDIHISVWKAWFSKDIINMGKCIWLALYSYQKETFNHYDKVATDRAFFSLPPYFCPDPQPEHSQKVVSTSPVPFHSMAPKLWGQQCHYHVLIRSFQKSYAQQVRLQNVDLRCATKQMRMQNTSRECEGIKMWTSNSSAYT